MLENQFGIKPNLENVLPMSMDMCYLSPRSVHWAGVRDIDRKYDLSLLKPLTDKETNKMRGRP